MIIQAIHTSLWSIIVSSWWLCTFRSIWRWHLIWYRRHRWCCCFGFLCSFLLGLFTFDLTPLWNVSYTRTRVSTTRLSTEIYDIPSLMRSMAKSRSPSTSCSANNRSSSDQSANNSLSVASCDAYLDLSFFKSDWSEAVIERDPCEGIEGGCCVKKCFVASIEKKKTHLLVSWLALVPTFLLTCVSFLPARRLFEWVTKDVAKEQQAERQYTTRGPT